MKHKKHSVGDCTDPKFMISDHVKKGLTEHWVLKCSNCDFTSDLQKLYKEVPSKGRGSKKADVNVGFAIGAETGAWNKARMLLACTNTSVMSRTGLKWDVNLVGQKSRDLNQSDMHDERNNINRYLGLTAEGLSLSVGNKVLIRALLEMKLCMSNNKKTVLF